MRDFLLPSLLFLIVVSIIASSPSCTPLSYQTPTQGSHGYRTWYSTQLLSLEHEGVPLCIPEGWEPIGALRHNHDSAVFPLDTTAVFIRADAFTSQTLSFTHSSYVVTLRIPINAESLDSYEAMVQNAFERTGALFADSKQRPARTHTVVVTAGLGYIDTEEGSVYPDPGPDVTYLILPPSDARSEELLLHAVAHIYNRFQDEGLEYQQGQIIPAADWQEAEASWIETAFRSSEGGRRARFESLYRAHTMHSLGIGMATNYDTSHENTQYAHYVLAPLVLIAIDGLLPPNTNVETLLTKIHGDSSLSFILLLENYLSTSELRGIEEWVLGNAKIPREILLTGLARYE